MAYHVEGVNITFDTIQEAREYAFNNFGSIDAVKSGPAPGMLTQENEISNTQEMTFTFVEGKERGDEAQTYLYGQEGEVKQVTVDELRAYFNDPDKVNRLPEVFGTFENYLAYMTEREQLIQSGVYDTGDWANADAGFTADQQMILEGDADLTIDPSDPNQNYENLLRRQRGAQVGAYENWINSEVNQALLQKYGVHATTYSDSGDKFRWNGTGYVKTQNEDHAGFVDFVKMGMMVALGAASAGAFSAAGFGTITSSTLSSAITQAVTTGSIDPEQLLQSAATAGLTGALTDYLGEVVSGVDLSSLSTGIEEVDNVLQTMAMDVLRQGIMTGDVDLKQTLQAGAFSAVGEFIDFIQGQMGISAEEQAAWEARIANQTTQQQAEMMELIETQFGEGALADALNSMEQQTALMVSQQLSNMFKDTGVSFVPDDTGTIVQEQDPNINIDPNTGENLGPINQIDNPFEGDELINGVYYNEAGFPVGIDPDATPEQILEQFVNDKNAWTTATGVSAHGLPDEAVAILVKASGNNIEGLSEFLSSNNLILAEAEGGYILISGADVTSGIHSNLDQNALFNLSTPTQSRFVPPPTYTEDNPLLDPTDTSSITEDLKDLLTNPEQQPPIPEYDFTVDPIDYEWEPLTDQDQQELDNFVETFTTENPNATAAEAVQAAQASGVTDANSLAAVAEALGASANEVYEALQNNGVSSAEAAAALVSNGTWTEQEAINAVTQTETTDINQEDSLNTSSGIYSAMENSQTARELHALMQRIENGDVTATQEQLDSLIQQWETSTGDVWDDSYLNEDPYENFEDLDFTDSSSQVQNQLTITEQNIINDIIETASNTGRQLTQTEQNLLNALNSGNVDVVRSVLNSISSGEQSILDVLSGLNLDATQIQNQVSELSGQLTNTERNIVEQILDSASASERQLSETEQNLVDALNSGDNRVIREVLNNISSGEQSILDTLSGLNVDTANIRGDLANLSSQLTNAEQNIVEQILNNALTTGRNLTESEQRIVEALQSGDNRVVRDILNGISSGEQSILEGLISLNIDTTDIQNQLSDLSGQLSGAERNIVEQILAGIQTTGRELTESETRLLEALSSGNTETVRDILNNISSGEQDILNDLSNLNIDVTSVQNSITNLNTSINIGLDGLADALGVQTSDIVTAIQNLGTGLTGDLTGLEGAVLQGLTGLANNIGTDIGTIVGSIEGLGTGIAANIQGLSDSLGSDIGAGFAGLGLELGEGLQGLSTDIGLGFEGLSGDIGLGFEGLGGQLGAGFEGLGGQLGTGFGGLMLGLAGLGELVPTQRDIYAAMPKERLTYTPSQFKGLGYERRTQPGMLTTPQAPSAMDAINQFIERNKTA